MPNFRKLCDRQIISCLVISFLFFSANSTEKRRELFTHSKIVLFSQFSFTTLIQIYYNTYLGNVIQSSKCAAYLSRHVGLRVGVPVENPAVTINRLCGSGFEAVVQGAQVRI